MKAVKIWYSIYCLLVYVSPTVLVIVVCVGVFLVSISSTVCVCVHPSVLVVSISSTVCVCVFTPQY